MVFLRNILFIIAHYIAKLFRRLLHKPDPETFNFIAILNNNYREGQTFGFIQVGANDGISYDQLYPFVKNRKSFGLVIEPLKDFYILLKNNYHYNEKIIAVQKAIHKTDKKVTLYRINPSNQWQLPSWAQGIASLNADHHKKTNIPTECIIAEEVEADDLMSVVKDNNIPKEIDLIQIDVEGYDYVVLKMIDFKKLQPKIIKLEYINLPHKEIIASIRFLRRNGYFTFMQNIDLIGVKISQISL